MSDRIGTHSWQKILYTTSLKNCVSFFNIWFFFKVGNLVLKQDIGLRMGIDPIQLWAYLFLCFLESKLITSSIIKSIKILWSRDISVQTDDRKRSLRNKKFSSFLKFIYPKKLELKTEHQSTHAIILSRCHCCGCCCLNV